MRLQRAALKTLNQWKAAPDHKPLLIRGARQTGKTWLVNEFANGQYDNIVSADFMQRPSLAGIFEQDLDPQRIVRQLELTFNQRILPGKTLLFFDEIQESPRALTYPRTRGDKPIAQECAALHLKSTPHTRG